MTSGPSSTPRIRVLSIPAGHDYVRHAVGPAAGVEVLADPVLDPAEPARWWPHPALEAAERPEVLDGADLVHVHFGYEHRTPGQVAEFVAAVGARGLPLLVTVHDLTNPHEPDPAAHLERTGHLVRGADAVITLTAGAAAEIRRHWGVDAHVIPHPRLMPPEITEPHRRGRLDTLCDQHARTREPAPRAVGVVLGSLRAGVAVEELLHPLAAALPPGTRLVMMVRSDALAAAREPGHPRHAAAIELDRLGPAVEIREHEHLSDADLCAALAGFDALVLPHRHGTHSGWLELCRDLGLPPVIPAIGHLVQQWGPGAASYDPARVSTEALTSELHAALPAALEGPPVPTRSPDAEDAAVARAHHILYREAVRNADRDADLHTGRPLSNRRLVKPLHVFPGGDH
ncbi:glycosyltransferase [Dietzia aurantiaca]|uniref:glycosyltransferase n=1 Tax=Dietzia aurantiaca TaxID=983873 RepID=UPI001E563DEA|nr:glycosyltransferase [Dietzia aurantiaca]